MSDLPPQPPGSNVMPFPGMPPPQPPPMILNPAFQQWMQLKQAWDAETARRQQQFLASCELIRLDAAKSYKIDIEADSTVAADEQAEKDARVEFLRAIVPFMEVMVPQMQQNPSIAPLAAEMIKFAFHAFPSSRQLEDALDTALQKMMQAPPTPPPQKGNTKSPMEIQTEAQIEGAKLQASQQQTQAKMQADQQTNATKLISAEIEAAADRERATAEHQLRTAELALKGREVVGREAIEQARLTHFAQRDTRGLV
jgi:hypothetical protein